MPLSDKFDTDQSVIEKFEFKGNGRTLSSHDIFHFKAKVYDSDTGVTLSSSDFPRCFQLAYHTMFQG